ncbi:hypothetical protein GE118_02650 [Mycoplasma sp. NEAQ87857]|uniref:MPN527 family putative ECF transporter permease subunit n=1 Tax=Mycoplasma sp. NEAQ87857 TaxID=2683967 RepID=UPI0013182FB9|nr:hypothetical protein [Mycoplasma sp. NEAQ87857]QGZ97694.1 hypothetical protein GE118_02650 [Mycoplasma sp. NEAQ87857]
MKPLVFKNRTSEVFKISFSAILLALILLSSFISRFLTIFGFLNIEISLVFILLSLYLVGFKYSIILTVARFAIAPLMHPGWLVINYLGGFILFLVQLFFIFIFILIHYLLNKATNKYNGIMFVISLILTMLATTILISTLNTFYFNTLYYGALGAIQNLSLSETIKAYNAFPLFFGIKNYYLGSYVFYISFNLINLTINLVLISIIIFLDYKTKFLSRMVPNCHNKY